MDRCASTYAAARAVFHRFQVTIRRSLARLGWALMTCLAAGAGCWCCGYVARENWLRMRHGASEPTPEDRRIANEAAAGIEQIEQFLTLVAGSPDQGS